MIEFLKERGLTLSEEKTTITNIYDGFDFLGFNVRKFGKRLYTSPSKDAQKRFRAKIGDIVKGHKMCKQESLIRMLNPVITGWGNYYRYGASTDAFMVVTITFTISRRNGLYVAIQRNASLGLQTNIGMKFGGVNGRLHGNMKPRARK